MGRLTRDGTAEPVTRDKILRRERGQGTFILPVQLTTSRFGNLAGLMHTLAICVTTHTYMHASQQPHTVRYKLSVLLWRCNIAVYCLHGKYVCLPDDVFLPFDPGLDLGISLCQNSINSFTCKTKVRANSPVP